jgi:hypothetical protein
MKKHPQYWIILSAKNDTMVCQRCGQEHLLALPMPINQAYDVMRGFVLAHKYCQEPTYDKPFEAGDAP